MKRQPPVSERRRAPRRKLDQPLASALTFDLEADVITVASGGAAVRLPFAPELGSRHVFVLPLGTSSLRLRGVVRRADPIPVGGFEVGIEFEDVAATDREQLEAFVAAKLGERSPGERSPERSPERRK